MLLFHIRNWFALFRGVLNRIKNQVIGNWSLRGLVVQVYTYETNDSGSNLSGTIFRS